MARVALGLDFGTESVRAVLIDCDDGTWHGSATHAFAHGVMEDELIQGTRLPPDFALQHPGDYLDGMEAAVRAALSDSAIDPADVVGIGVDFTACTMLPLDARGQPLCISPDYSAEPHAWVKLWKHHGANREASEINRLAEQLQEPWLGRYGGTTSPEWMLAKAWETARRAPEVYRAAARFAEAGDWVVEQLTGTVARGACAAGYKGMWHGQDGPPATSFLERLDPVLTDFFTSKQSGEVVPAGHRVGTLHAAGASRLGLREGVPVSAPIIDAHAAVPGCGVTGPGHLVIILGTSSCHMLMGQREVLVPGIQGVVENGILPGSFGYEAGQAATGDLLDWYVDRLLGCHGEAEAAAHRDLTEKAARLAAGSTGLLALDWWNGNRSVLIDPELSGLIVGLTRGTRSDEIYRALIEGTAFGTRVILENFQQHDVPVEAVTVVGGMAEKNELLLQIYADVTGRQLNRAATTDVCALGAAIFGALAAGAEGGGHADIGAAVSAMVPEPAQRVRPSAGNHKVYSELYRHWLRLHDHFGRGTETVMKFLRKMRHSGNPTDR